MNTTNEERAAEQAMFERLAVQAHAAGRHQLADTYSRAAEMVAARIISAATSDAVKALAERGQS